MEKGFNSDLKIFGDFYHVQTEDWGLDAMIIVTRIFKNGAVLKSFKTPYADLVQHLPLVLRKQKVREALRNQHRKILDLLQGGQMLNEKSKLNM